MIGSIDIIIFIAYFSGYSILYFLLKKRISLLAFAPIVITTGSVYISALLASIIIFNFYYIQKKINLNTVIKILLFVTPILFLTLVQRGLDLNVLELIQFVFVISISVQALAHRRSIREKDTTSLRFGFLIGSVIIAVALLVKVVLGWSFNQFEYHYFSISSTFNYTAYYLFFGLIISPKQLDLSVKWKLILFLIFLTCIVVFQARAALVLGMVMFFYMNRPQSKVKLLLFGIPTILSAIYLIVWMDILDAEDQNDLVYSIGNFSSNYSNLQRLEMILESFNSLFDTPLGWGIGQSGFALSHYGFEYPHAHNLIANWFYEFGIFGVILVITFIIFLRSMWRIERSRVASALVGFIFIYSLTESIQFNVLLSITTIMALMTLSDGRKFINLRKE